ncbi:PqiA family integral membrane protein [Caballeronia arationis]|jgi:paraquat-inducible protein A|uniref:Integral membrane protein, PqiA family n=1 Tax=Caballeronia arationis TaxID=1777142 RepID=A0A7Z7N1H3_9BURK|nr:paraquat-inducible protein A [Caballeronia arationis]SAL06439.1 PqiA family integral membrane protein [Caballeronia arationis]SOE56617.1 integral membrane protein, PqiA family [Caballeronia arationis]
MKHTPLIACHECDLLQRETALRRNGIARCTRCGAELYRNRPDSLNRTFACTLAAMVLFAVANAFPIVGLSVNGDLVQTTLFGAVRILYRDGMWPLAGLVFFTTILMPMLQMAGIAYLLLPLPLGRVPPQPAVVFRLVHWAMSWGMTEVLILGVLVALVKLAHIAGVVPGIALWAFGALMLLLAAMSAAFDPREFPERVRPSQRGAGVPADTHTSASASTAARAGLFACHECGLLSKARAHAHEGGCPRCGAPLHFRKPESIARTWAFLMAAMVLYIPANTLPMMHTSSIFGAQRDTIMSGVVYLWTSGSWPLAVVLFIASVAVPMLKIVALIFLVATAQRRSRWLPELRTRIYRVVEFVGRWSMLDIYVVTVRVALVQFNTLATIQAGPAAIAFGAVVVLTMFAAVSFDPRFIWDANKAGHG